MIITIILWKGWKDTEKKLIAVISIFEVGEFSSSYFQPIQRKCDKRKRNILHWWRHLRWKDS